MNERRPSRRRWLWLTASGALAAGGLGRGLLACTSSDPQTRPESPVLRHLALEIALPLFVAFSDRTAAFAEATAALVDGADETRLATAQQAWRDARAPWKHGRAFGFGPAEQFDGDIDWWPAKPDTIEAIISGSDVIDGALVDGLGTSVKGFMALEHLLFDPEGGDQAVLDGFADAMTGGRRRALVRELGADLAEQAAGLLAAWDPNGGDYAGQLAKAGSGSEVYAAQQDGLNHLINQVLFLSELVATSEIGKPLGTSAGGEPQPDLVRAARSDNSIDDMSNHLHGIRAAYTGVSPSGEVQGPGMGLLVSEQSAELDQRFTSEIDAAIAAVEAIPRPFSEALFEHPGAVEAAFEAVKTVKRTMGAEIVGALNGTVTFNDNDGD